MKRYIKYLDENLTFLSLVILLMVPPAFVLAILIKHTQAYFYTISLVIDPVAIKKMLTQVITDMGIIILLIVSIFCFLNVKSSKKFFEKLLYRYSLTLPAYPKKTALKRLNLCISILSSLIIATSIILLVMVFANKANHDNTYKEANAPALDLTQEQMELIAVHEAGHFIIQMYEFNDDYTYIEMPSKAQKEELMKNFNIDLNGSLGFNIIKKRNIINEEDFLKGIRVDLGGQIGVEVKYRKKYSGASSDLNDAYTLVVSYVNNGMSKYSNVPWVALTTDQQNEVYSEIINAQQAEVRNILQANKDKLLALASKVLKDGRVTNDEAKKIIGNLKHMN
ncbi:MAG: hypothetical protein N3B21_17895 [Clostridia bacterium]|nr:hypothetical protein [Clostridia bacterium]